jgi:hypothetical protein
MAVPIARILSISGAVGALANLNQLALQAKGAIRDSLRLHILVQPLVIGAVLIGAQFNLWIVAVTFILGNLIFLVVSYRYLDRLIGVSLLNVFTAARASLVVTVTSTIVPIVVLIATHSEPHLIAFFIASIGTVLGWVVGIISSGHPLADELKGVAVAIRQRSEKA